MWTFRFSAPPNPGPPLRGLCAVGWKPLHDRHGAAAHIRETALAGTGPQMPRHLAQQHANDRLAEIVAPGEQIPDPMRQRQYPLPHRDIRDDVVHEVCGTLGHAPAATAWTEAAALAREGDQALGLAPNAPESREPSGEPGAPATRTGRGGVGAIRTRGTPGTPPRQSAARPRRRAGAPRRRGTSAGARARHDAARPPRDRAGCSRPTAGPRCRSRHIVCRWRRRISVWRCRDVPGRRSDLDVRHARVVWHVLHGRRRTAPRHRRFRHVARDLRPSVVTGQRCAVTPPVHNICRR